MPVCTRSRSLAIAEEYHEISTQLSSPLWKELAENRLLAQHVRTLKVQGDYGGDDQVIPTAFRNLEVPPVPDLESFENVEAVRNYFAEKNAKDLEAERILVSALKGMSGLTSFEWARTPPLIDRNQEDDIWITLANHCPSLKDIDVYDCGKPYEPLLRESDDPAYQRPIHNPNFYLLKNLKSFTFTTEAYDFPTSLLRRDVTQCAKMLVERCPNLKHLSLEYTLEANPDTITVFASPLLSGPSWNSLRSLTLYGFEFISTELSLFLASHPTIEILSLFNSKIDQFFVLPSHTLPRLKRLSTGTGEAVVLNAILNSTLNIPRPLEYIGGYLLNDAFLDCLQQCGGGPTLQTLFLRDDVGTSDFGRLMTRLSGIAPNLKGLDIRAKKIVDRTLYPVFGQFPQLEFLKGMQFISSSCEPASENTERIRALATLCPNLLYIGDQIDPPNKDFTLAVTIYRDEHDQFGDESPESHRDGTVRWSLYKAEEDTKYEHWGERGQGSFEL